MDYAPKDTLVNINRQVRFRATKRGLEVMAAHLGRYSAVGLHQTVDMWRDRERTDDPVAFRMALWEFMQVFGPAVWHGGPNYIVDNDLELGSPI